MTAAASKQSEFALAQSVTTLPGVGPERTAQLARLEIFTIEDLLLHRPRRYEDRRHLRAIRDLQEGEAAATHGRIVALGVKWFKQHTKSVFEIVLDDGTARLHCRWWNLPFMEKYFATGDEVIAFGKPVSLKPRVMDHPETEVVEGGEESVIHFNRLTPVYPLTEGLPQRWLRSLIWRTLERFEPHIADPWNASAVEGNKAQGLGSGRPLPSRARALHMLHVPEAEHEPDLARRRLALDEFVELQCGIQQRRRNLETKAQALPCGGDNRLIRPFLAQRFVRPASDAAAAPGRCGFGQDRCGGVLCLDDA